MPQGKAQGIVNSSCLVGEETTADEILYATNDQHMIRSGEQIGVEPIFAENSFRRRVPNDEKGRLPSDHLAYEVHYKVTW